MALGRLGMGFGKLSLGKGVGGSIITSIFADGTDGFYFNFGTLSKLWKDTAATTPVAVAGDSIARSDDTSPRGQNGTQATGAAQPKWQTGDLSRYDGVDDNLLTSVVPGLAMTLIFKLKGTAASINVAGGRNATVTTRCILGINAGGQLCAGVGADSQAVIVGGADIRNVVGVAALVFNGSTISLLWNNSVLYSAAQNGAPNTDTAIPVGASNIAGALGSFWAGDIYHALVIKKALTAAQIEAITNLWGTI